MPSRNWSISAKLLFTIFVNSLYSAYIFDISSLIAGILRAIGCMASLTILMTLDLALKRSRESCGAYYINGGILSSTFQHVCSTLSISADEGFERKSIFKESMFVDCDLFYFLLFFIYIASYKINLVFILFYNWL